MEETYIYIYSKDLLNKREFSFPLSLRAQAYKMEYEKRRRYREEEDIASTSPSR